MQAILSLQRSATYPAQRRSSAGLPLYPTPSPFQEQSTLTIGDCMHGLPPSARFSRVDTLGFVLASRERIPCATLSYAFGCQPGLLVQPDVAAAIANAVLRSNSMQATTLQIRFRNHNYKIMPSPLEDTFWEKLISSSYPPNVTTLVIHNYPGNLPKTMAAILTKTTSLREIAIVDCVDEFIAETTEELEAWQETGLRQSDLQALGQLIKEHTFTLTRVSITDLRFHHALCDPKEQISKCIYKPLTRCYWMENLKLTKMHQWKWTNPEDVPTTITRSRKRYSSPSHNVFVPGKELRKTLTIGTTLAPIRRAYFPHTQILSEITPQQQLSLILDARHDSAAVFAAFRVKGQIPPQVQPGILSHPTALRRSPARSSRYNRIARSPILDPTARYANFFNNPCAPRNSLPITNHPWDTSSINYHLQENAVTITTSSQMAPDASYDTPSLEDLLQQNTLSFPVVKALRLRTRYRGPIDHHSNGPLCFYQEPPEHDIPMNTFRRLYTYLVPGIISLFYYFQDNELNPPDRTREDNFAATLFADAPDILEYLILAGLSFNANRTFEALRLRRFPNLMELILVGPVVPFHQYDSICCADDELIENVITVISRIPSLQRLEIIRLPLRTIYNSIQGAFSPLIDHLKQRPLIQQTNFIAMRVPRSEDNRDFIQISTSSLRFWRRMKRAFDINLLPWPPRLHEVSSALWLRLIRTLITDRQSLRYLLLETDLPSRLNDLTFEQWFSLLIALGCDKRPRRMARTPGNYRLFCHVLQHPASMPHVRTMILRSLLR